MSDFHAAKVPLGLQLQCIETLIRKGAVAKLRRAGDLSHEQAKAMEDWLLGSRDTLVFIREHEAAIRECITRENGNARGQ